MIRPRNETEDLLYSITKNCETLIKQTLTEAQQTFEFKMIKPGETSDFIDEKVRDELKKDLEVTDVTAADLQDDIIPAINNKENREQVTKRIK